MKAIFIAFVILVSHAKTSHAFFDDNRVYTLYRNSIMNQNMRIHIATFDSDDGDQYNKENCDLAASLFQQQSDVKTKFWCERGQYKK